MQTNVDFQVLKKAIMIFPAFANCAFVSHADIINLHIYLGYILLIKKMYLSPYSVPWSHCSACSALSLLQHTWLKSQWLIFRPLESWWAESSVLEQENQNSQSRVGKHCSRRWWESMRSGSCITNATVNWAMLQEVNMQLSVCQWKSIVVVVVFFCQILKIENLCCV